MCKAHTWLSFPSQNMLGEYQRAWGWFTSDVAPLHCDWLSNWGHWFQRTQAELQGNGSPSDHHWTWVGWQHPYSLSKGNPSLHVIWTSREAFQFAPLTNLSAKIWVGIATVRNIDFRAEKLRVQSHLNSTNESSQCLEPSYLLETCSEQGKAPSKSAVSWILPSLISAQAGSKHSTFRIIPFYISSVDNKSFKLASVLLMELKGGSILRICPKDLGLVGPQWEGCCF